MHLSYSSSTLLCCAGSSSVAPSLFLPAFAGNWYALVHHHGLYWTPSTATFAHDGKLKFHPAPQLTPTSTLHSAACKPISARLSRKDSVHVS
ncbi:hypothetical protein BD311DRAFT_759762 [Dichomitus squalens]|uniref:Uncharacterized protein n=1 Tax=Dichomitus squalens TaxID=114155 RepID=A0A4Q9MK82_9APHY|nr:hypothetical protein BD311DRAFT_759762 [Dichomitus squalens]TBU53301.1 hypothetical protein BD310DRAFT_938330 [Dichomitus squalens]